MLIFDKLTFASEEERAELIEITAVSLEELAVVVVREAGVFRVARDVNDFRLPLARPKLPGQQIERQVSLDEARTGQFADVADTVEGELLHLEARRARYYRRVVEERRVTGGKEKKGAFQSLSNDFWFELGFRFCYILL